MIALVIVCFVIFVIMFCLLFRSGNVTQDDRNGKLPKKFNLKSMKKSVFKKEKALAIKDDESKIKLNNPNLTIDNPDKEKPKKKLEDVSFQTLSDFESEKQELVELAKSKTSAGRMNDRAGRKQEELNKGKSIDVVVEDLGEHNVNEAYEGNDLVEEDFEDFEEDFDDDFNGFNDFESFGEYENFIDGVKSRKVNTGNKSLSEEIKDLSPELKTILISNVLQKKDDNE